ncbi:hypothetical protein J4772_33265 [Cohnella sp. LGH]|uniref:DUF6470 family protein n=1 Tax=Cohnella sp. LGH TaxID=1619153 RepID=UPI001ADB3620|nr:DUF6470 family protein [Cohnella sp. LGH]QTH42294.1 hypothetical protein J4772_33265 [Cohnella sp. LGH]
MFPRISIQSQRALIGIESQRGQYEISRPQPELKIHSERATITANNKPGMLSVDQNLTNDALTGGKPQAFWERIYSQYKQVAAQNIQQIVENGNRMGALHIKGSPIADIALGAFIEGAPDLQVFGHASPTNIAFQYTPNDVNIQVERGKLTVDAQIHRPDIQFHRGSVRIYMQQYPKVTITPPEIDITA